MKTKRLEILEASLIKKNNLFDQKLKNHIDTVKQANGQPLNDKRNGQATLNKWEKQNDSLKTLKDGIEKTEKAIEREKGKIIDSEDIKNILPSEVLDLIESGILIQWRKYPNTFFVNGVDKARICWDVKKKIVSHKYINTVKDKDQWRLFAKIFNKLRGELND